jgi:hypothetical protein
MKKSYITPKTCTIPLKGPVLMLEGSQTVGDYKNGDNIFVGDED